MNTFHATRTAARNHAKEFGGKVKDNGSTAKAGERWEVQVELPPANAIAAYNETQQSKQRWDLLQDAETMASIKPGIIGYEVLKTPNNKPVDVSYRRSMTAVRLRNHLANAS